MRAPLLVLALVLGGCATGPEAGSPPSGPFSLETRPDPAVVDALRQRLSPWLLPPGQPCLATLVAEQVDVAHALLGAGLLDDAQRGALIGALPPAEATAWQGQPAPWRAAEQTLLAAATALATGEPAPALPVDGWPTASQAARATYLRLGADWVAGRPLAPAELERALAWASADWTVAQRLEEMRTLGGFELPESRARRWHLQLAGSALERGRALVAIQHAAAARMISTHGTGDAAADRALLTRAYLAARQADAALNESERATALARTPTQRARAEALYGQALLLCEDPWEAAEAFGRAQQAALDARDEAGVLRQALNRSVAWLRAGEAELATQAADELRALAVTPVGPEAPDLLARREIVGGLADLLAGQRDPNQVAAQVEAALTRARQAGLVAVVETYAGLPTRLRQGRP